MPERSAENVGDSAVAAVPASPPTGSAALTRALHAAVPAPAAFFAPTAGAPAGLTASHAASAEVSPAIVAMLEELVDAWQASSSEPSGEVSGTFERVAWQLFLAESRTSSGARCGAVAIARPAQETLRWSSSEILIVQAFASLCGSDVESEGGDARLASQRGLDALVTRIAVELMSVSAPSLDKAEEWLLRVLTEFFEVDTSFLRRNDLDHEMTVLVAEWPRRQNVPDPDPLEHVPFGVDPVFDMTRDLKEPFVMRPSNATDTYQERVEQASGVGEVSMAMVPLIRNDATVGVLGFVKFGDRPWDTKETNALQAAASLMVQLQARVEAEERLEYEAHHDELTSLPNRRALLEELDQRLNRTTGETLGLLFLDLDRFKVLNDFLGHGAGDRLLVAVAERLRSAMGAGDFVARLAADQFVFLLEKPRVELEALALADKLLELVAEPIEISGHDVGRTASLGISFSGTASIAAEDLLAHANVALHLGKEQGGNQAVVFDEALRASVKQRSETELELREAIDHGGLLLYFQPELDLRTGRLLAMEALVRWDHPQRGVLPAGSFIQAAEETGLIVDLGRWVLAEACRQMSEWRERYPRLSFTMRVNMSPAQLATRNIVRLVKECLHENQLPGELLCLEITEHAVMQDLERAVQVLHDLKALGVSLAIDDFGTGYSSMSQLKRLPVDVLKIDQGFVAGLGLDGRDRAIVDATVRLARSFGLDVVAEGVETVELVHELLALDCFRAQGFLLCKPKEAGELEPMLQRGGVAPEAFRRREHVLIPA
jgi:diguanylate cyclase (GGDEF)-like protein